MYIAEVAQMVERCTEDAKVPRSIRGLGIWSCGNSPPGGSTFARLPSQITMVATRPNRRLLQTFPSLEQVGGEVAHGHLLDYSNGGNMAHGLDIKKVGIQLGDGTVFIMDDTDVVSIDVALEHDTESMMSRDGMPLLFTGNMVAHMHLHLVSGGIGRHMQGPRPKEIDARDLTLALGEGE